MKNILVSLLDEYVQIKQLKHLDPKIKENKLDELLIAIRRYRKERKNITLDDALQYKLYLAPETGINFIFKIPDGFQKILEFHITKVLDPFILNPLYNNSNPNYDISFSDDLKDALFSHYSRDQYKEVLKQYENIESNKLKIYLLYLRSKYGKNTCGFFRQPKSDIIPDFICVENIFINICGD